jgi:hypothetical protein
MSTAAFVEGPAEARPELRAEHRPVEVGAWTLEYLGPGFRVQVRVTHSGGHAHLSGWISPALAARVFLVYMVRRATPVEAVIGASGRFDFDHLPSGGGYRFAFLTENGERPIMTPPFWA